MSGWVLITPMQFGPIIVMSYASHSDRSRASRAIPTSPTSRKPAVITTSPRTPFFPQSSTASSDVGRYGDDREIHSIGNLEDARIRADPVDARRLRVHRVDRPLVFVHDEVVEDFVADLSSMTRSADDCDGRRREDCVESGSGHRGAKPPARLEGSRLIRCVPCYPVLKSVARGITAPFE